MPESLEIVAHHRKNATEYSRIADGLSIPHFSCEFRENLCKLLGGGDNVSLFEAVSRIGNYGDSEDFAALRKAVSRLLRERGVRLPRGKRPKPGLQELVKGLTPLLLHMGLPLASSERSRLVVVLRGVAEDMEVQGDPRDTLRSLIKIERETHAASQKALQEMFLNALQLLLPPDRK